MDSNFFSCSGKERRLELVCFYQPTSSLKEGEVHVPIRSMPLLDYSSFLSVTGPNLSPICLGKDNRFRGQNTPYLPAFLTAHALKVKTGRLRLPVLGCDPG